jgi:hypothetical protein
VGVVAAVFLIPWAGGEEPEASEELAAAEVPPPAQEESTTPAQTQPMAQETVQVTPPDPRPEPAPPPTVAAETTLTKWTSTWVNLRNARDPDAEIVRVLNPGEQVEVADLVGGWWVVFVDGEMVGFVARSLILDQPPGAEPDTAVPAFRLP